MKAQHVNGEGYIAQEHWTDGGRAHWFIISKDENEYCYGLVHILGTECGYFDLNEVKSVGGFKNRLFKPKPIKDCERQLEYLLDNPCPRFEEGGSDE